MSVLNGSLQSSRVKAVRSESALDGSLLSSRVVPVFALATSHEMAGRSVAALLASQHSHAVPVSALATSRLRSHEMAAVRSAPRSRVASHLRSAAGAPFSAFALDAIFPALVERATARDRARLVAPPRPDRSPRSTVGR